MRRHEDPEPIMLTQEAMSRVLEVIDFINFVIHTCMINFQYWYLETFIYQNYLLLLYVMIDDSQDTNNYFPKGHDTISSTLLFRGF